MIDTHSHLLPGLDDGAADVSEALRLAVTAVEEGVERVVCTPHAHGPEDPALTRGLTELAAMRRQLESAGVSLELVMGYELSFSFAESIEPSGLRGLTLGPDSRAVLVEVPYLGWPAGAHEAVSRWVAEGLTPVLAHPERNGRVQDDPRILEGLLALGAVAQGTLPSLLGTFGRRARSTFLRLLSRGTYSLVASDAHFGWRRPMGVAEGLAMLRKVAPDADLESLVLENPRRLLLGDPLRRSAPVRVVSGGEKYFDGEEKSFVGRLLRPGRRAEGA